MKTQQHFRRELTLQQLNNY